MHAHTYILAYFDIVYGDLSAGRSTWRSELDVCIACHWQKICYRSCMGCVYHSRCLGRQEYCMQTRVRRCRWVLTVCNKYSLRSAHECAIIDLKRVQPSWVVSRLSSRRDRQTRLTFISNTPQISECLTCVVRSLHFGCAKFYFETL